MHNYHSLVQSHEKRIVVGSLINLNLTLRLTAEQNLNFSVGTRLTNKSRAEKKLHNSDFCIISSIAEIRIIEIKNRSNQSDI